MNSLLKMIITEKNTQFFANLYSDTNKIHLDKKFSNNFFFKQPIVHGANLINYAIAKFVKVKGFKLLIKNLSINLKNFLLVGENFEIKIYKKKIIVKSELNTKLEIDLEYERIKKKITKNTKPRKINTFQHYKIKNLYNYCLLEQLIFISYYIGSVKPGNGSLIHKININYSTKNIKQFKLTFKKKISNVFCLNYCNKFYKVEVIASKLKPFKENYSKYKLSPKAIKNIKNKKILIFGSTSDIGKRLASKELTTVCKIFKHSFRISFNNPNISKVESQKINQKINKIKPNFIFYLSSPIIYNGNKNNLKLSRYYNCLFVDYFEKIVNIIRNNNYDTKIFYPSSIYLENKKEYRRLECYLLSKERAEKICKLNKNERIVSLFRIPQLISRSNYNMLGFYEGKSLSVLDKFFNNFFEQV